MDCTLDNDRSFGPWAGGCRGQFDFTLLFEESILTLIPAVALLLVGPPYVWHLLGRARKVQQGWWLAGKVAVSAALAQLQLVLVVLRSLDAYRTRATIAVSIVSFFASLLLAVLVWLQHVRTVRPGNVILAFLSLNVLFDLAIVRTLWLVPVSRAIPIVYTTAFAFKASLLVAESVEKKRATLLPSYQHYGPEALAGFFNRAAFGWVNPLLLRGSREILTLRDLLSLDRKLHSEGIQANVTDHWQRHRQSTSRNALLWTLVGCFKWTLLAGLVPRACLVALTVVQPFLIETAINLSAAPSTPVNKNHGYAMVGAYALVYTGIAVTTGQFSHKSNRLVVEIRGGLVAAIYRKTLLLPSSAASPAAAITLMSTDIERIAGGVTQVHETWASVVELAIAIWLLERQLGVAVVIPVGFGIVASILAVILAKRVTKGQTAWILAIQQRVATTAGTLGIMKSLRLSGLAGPAWQIIRDLRKVEVEASKRLRKIFLGTIMLTTATPVIAPVLTFLVYALTHRGDLSTTRAFTSLSVFALLTGPLATLYTAVPTLIGARACIDRVQEYLRLPDREESRVCGALNPSTTTVESLSSRDSASEKQARVMARSLMARHTVVVHEGAFGWAPGAEPTLPAISFRIQRGTVNMVIGPVASGKTTLLMALLGELPVSEGFVGLSSWDLAYCAQSPWIPGGTVQQGILGVYQYQPAWYRTVVAACGLEPDIASWPLGDQTQVGSKGVTLSGGQRQRLDLARAVYSQHELLLLDDCLSGLDNDTEKAVFDRVLGPHGLLRGQGRTVIWTSSNPRRLPSADHVIVLGSEGRIVEQGGYEELLEREGYVFGLSLPPVKEAAPPSLAGIETPETQTQTQSVVSQLQGSVEKGLGMTPIAPDVESVDEADAGLNVQLPSEEDLARSTGDWTVYRFYFKAFGWFAVGVFLFSMVIFVFGTSFPNIWIKWWSESELEHAGAETGKYVGVYAALGFGSVLALIVGCWDAFLFMVPDSALHFHGVLADTVSQATMHFFASTDIGTTLNRFSQDLMLIDMELPSAALSAAIAALTCVGQIVLLAVSAKYIALAVPLLFVVFYFLQKYYLRTSRQLRFLDLESKSSLYTQFEESLSGLVTLRAYGWQVQYAVRNFRYLDTTQRPYYLLLSIQRWLNFTIDMIIAIMAIVLIVLAMQAKSLVSPGYTGVALLNIMSFNQTMKFLVTSWTQLETSIGSISRVKAFAAATEREDTGEDASEPPVDWPSRGEIEIRNLSASYTRGEPVLHDINLHIRPGEKVGICGKTGSGKTSLILSLFCMMEIEGGSIVVDGVDLATVPKEVVRHRLTAVAQDAHTLSGTVRFNADPTGTVSDADITATLQRVSLWDSIAAAGGLDAEMAQVPFSHGQKQLFSLARALMHGSRVIVLDEATSSGDSDTEALVADLLQNELRHCTVISVAHRVASLVDFDQVAVFGGGQLVELGNAQELLLQGSSTFAQLLHSA